MSETVCFRKMRRFQTFGRRPKSIFDWTRVLRAKASICQVKTSRCCNVYLRVRWLMRLCILPAPGAFRLQFAEPFLVFLPSETLITPIAIQYSSSTTRAANWCHGSANVNRLLILARFAVSQDGLQFLRLALWVNTVICIWEYIWPCLCIRATRFQPTRRFRDVVMIARANISTKKKTSLSFPPNFIVLDLIEQDIHICVHKCTQKLMSYNTLANSRQQSAILRLLSTSLCLASFAIDACAP